MEENWKEIFGTRGFLKDIEGVYIYIYVYILNLTRHIYICIYI